MCLLLWLYLLRPKKMWISHYISIQFVVKIRIKFIHWKGYSSSSWLFIPRVSFFYSFFHLSLIWHSRWILIYHLVTWSFQNLFLRWLLNRKVTCELCQDLSLGVHPGCLMKNIKEQNFIYPLFLWKNLWFNRFLVSPKSCQ